MRRDEESMMLLDVVIGVREQCCCTDRTWDVRTFFLNVVVRAHTMSRSRAIDASRRRVLDEDLHATRAVIKIASSAGCNLMLPCWCRSPALDTSRQCPSDDVGGKAGLWYFWML